MATPPAVTPSGLTVPTLAGPLAPITSASTLLHAVCSALCGRLGGAHVGHVSALVQVHTSPQSGLRDWGGIARRRPGSCAKHLTVRDFGDEAVAVGGRENAAGSGTGEMGAEHKGIRRRRIRE